MPGFHLHRSSSTAALADQLVATVTARGAAPALEADEIVIVQGRGMERWLGQRVAARLGVWAGAWCPYPRAAAAELAGRVLGEPPPERAGGDALILMFAVAAELAGVADRPDGERVRRYMAEDPARLLAFAQQAADALDGYILHRADMLAAWEEGRLTGESVDEPWQAALWRAVRARAGRRTAEGDARLETIVDFWPRVERARQALLAGAPCPGIERVSVFAVANAPRNLVRFMVALGRACEVHWHAVDPAAEAPGSPAPLVAALCATDLESSAVVMDAAAEGRALGVAVHATVLPGPAVQDGAPLLARVQWQARTGERRRAPRGTLAADRSIRVHACGGPMREVEVLHDEILRAFDELPGLAPEDIVVLVPSIGAYAPLVEAIAQDGRGIGASGTEARLPVRVADLSDRDGSPIATALAEALRMADGDMGLADVLRLLAQPALEERLLPRGVSAETLVRWLADAGARRFLDADHRAEAGLPRAEEGTLDAALDRLYAGLAAPDGGEEPPAETSVFPSQPFMADAEAVGRASEAAELLRALRRIATSDGASGRTISEWLRETRALLARLAPAHGEGEREARALRQGLGALEEASRAAGFDAPVPFRAARSLILESLEHGRPGRGFLTGGVTVCQFVPMRAVPFRVVCMLGMDDAQYPRGAPRPAFDMLADAPMPGDPDQRADDRALFLQSVLGAGERLIVLHPARDLATGSERAVSTCVAALLDAAAESACEPGAAPEEVAAARRALVIEHPLHAFSVAAWDPRAARDDRVGYDALARAAAERLAGTTFEERARLLSAPTEPVAAAADRAAPDAPDMPDAALDLDQLVAFFRDPARAALRAWGVAPAWTAEPPPAHEPIVLEPRDEARILGDLMRAALETGAGPRDDAVDRLARGGRLPIGPLGRGQGRAQVLAVQSALAEVFPRGFQWMAVDVALAGARLVGRVPVAEGRVVACEGGAFGARGRIAAWIAQLAFAAQHGDASEGVHVSAYEGRTRPIPPVARAQALQRLDALVALRAFGLERGLPFVPDPSLRVAEAALAGPDDAARALRDARRAWREAEGQDKDPFGADVRHLYRGQSPLEGDFGAVPGVCRASFGEVASAVWAGAIAPSARGGGRGRAGR